MSRRTNLVSKGIFGRPRLVLEGGLTTRGDEDGFDWDEMSAFEQFASVQALNSATDAMRDAVTEAYGDLSEIEVHLSAHDPDGNDLMFLDLAFEEEAGTPAEIAAKFKEFARDLNAEYRRLAKRDTAKAAKVRPEFDRVLDALSTAGGEIRTKGKGGRKSARHLRQRAVGQVRGPDKSGMVAEARRALESASELVHEAVSDVMAAIKILRKVPESGVLAGNMDAYLRPWLERMLEGDRGGGIYLKRAVADLEELEDELENGEDDPEGMPQEPMDGRSAGDLETRADGTPHMAPELAREIMDAFGPNSVVYETMSIEELNENYWRFITEGSDRDNIATWLDSLLVGEEMFGEEILNGLANSESPRHAAAVDDIGTAMAQMRERVDAIASRFRGL